MNCPEWVLVQYATARVGAVMVTINPAYRAHELAYVLNQSGVSLLFASLAHKTSDYRAMVGRVRGECPGLRETVYFGDASWDAFLTRAAGELRPEPLSCDEPVNIQYTSGTTGFPKGPRSPPQHPQQRLLRRGDDRLRRAGPDLRPGPVLPLLRHGHGQPRGHLARRLHGDPRPSFDPAATLRAVQEERCTSLYGVPTMFIAELNLPDFATYDLSTLRTGIMAGSPCPVEVMKRVVAEMNMAEVSICYGMTETSPSPPRPAATTTWSAAPAPSAGSCRTSR